MMNYRIEDIESVLISHWMDPIDTMPGIVADHLFIRGYDVSVFMIGGEVEAMKVNWPGETEWYGIDKFGQVTGEVPPPYSVEYIDRNFLTYER